MSAAAPVTLSPLAQRLHAALRRLDAGYEPHASSGGFSCDDITLQAGVWRDDAEEMAALDELVAAGFAVEVDGAEDETHYRLAREVRA